jgi:hypothetical protein
VKLRSYKLGDTPLKTVEDLTLLKTDKCVITASKDMLALSITFNEQVHGCFMHGSGRLIVDTIIETSKGAIGEPTEKNLKNPFIMIGGVEEIEDKMAEADLSSLASAGYENIKALKRKAEDLCEELLERRVSWTRFETNLTRVFLFEVDGGNYDMLISKNTKKLVYVSASKVYVFSGNKILLSRPNEVLISKPGKSIVIAKGNVFLFR